ncbi:hypothetical protein CHS0354_001088 [Potamilus streckersoni]|uniref:Uncharacterized protein n=1 Tax=Potamilus streckersoni TaxID=2493646 RepID=A0AAE0VKS2_9BIVA|nr:hypothetical protein CHS0354_001088 [Potamilus streckersoni]
MDPHNQGAWYINVTWTPTETDVNLTHFLCFSASDEKRLTSAIRCIYFAVIQGLAITSTTGRMKTTLLKSLTITDRQDHLTRKTFLSSTTTAAKLVPPAEEATIKFTNTTVLSALRSTPNRTSLPLTGKTTQLITEALRSVTTIMSARTIAVTETNMSLTSRSATTITTMSTIRRHISTTISQREKITMATTSLPSNATPIKTTVVMPTAAKAIPTSAISAGQTASATTKFPSGATSSSTDIANTITPSIESNTPALRLLQTTPKIAVPISTMTTTMANVPSSATIPTTVLSSPGTSEAAVRSSSLTTNVSVPTYNTAAVLSSAKTATTTVLLSTTSSTNPPSTTSAPATTVSSLTTNDASVTSLATTMTTSVLSSKKLSKTTGASSGIFISTAITSSTTITTSATPPWSTTTTTKMLTASQENISQALNTEARKGSSTGIEMQWWHLAIAVSVAAIFMTGCCIFFCLFLYKRRQEEEDKNKIRVMHSGRETGQENGNMNPSFYRPAPPTKRPSLCQPLIPTTPLSYKSPPHYNAWM